MFPASQCGFACSSDCVSWYVMLPCSIFLFPWFIFSVPCRVRFFVDSVVFFISVFICSSSVSVSINSCCSCSSVNCLSPIVRCSVMFTFGHADKGVANVWTAIHTSRPSNFFLPIAIPIS